jgi:hypothetical protein
VGVLFIIATVASISTIAFVGFLSEPDYLAEVAANEGQVLGGVFVEFIWALSLLALITLSQEYVTAGAPDSSFYPTAGALLLVVRDWTFLLGAGLAFTISAVILNYVLWQTRLVPRWLSGWGLLGAGLMFASYSAQFFGFGPPDFFFVPIAVQEMVFAVWLIAKGFDQSTLASLSAQQNQTT